MKKIMISLGIISSVTLTVVNMNASPQYEFKDEVRLQELVDIRNNVKPENIREVSFLNNDVDIDSCEQVFKENNFKHYQYNDCIDFVDELKLYNEDKKQANDTLTDKKDFTI